jgi:hypothetical protein
MTMQDKDEYTLHPILYEDCPFLGYMPPLNSEEGTALLSDLKGYISEKEGIDFSLQDTKFLLLDWILDDLFWVSEDKGLWPLGLDRIIRKQRSQKRKA